MERRIGEAMLAVVHGDITRLPADAIGNAANEALRGGGGVDGAIHSAGGPDILAELRRRYPHGTPTGTAVATAAGRLPARWVIHAVGPIWMGGGHGEEALLASAYASAVARAVEVGAQTLTLPAISAGIYGYPLGDAARVAGRAVAAALDAGAPLERVTFVCRGSDVQAAFEAALGALP